MQQDVALAKALGAHSPSVQDANDTASKHGVDLILGGHDHLYFVTKGVTAWEGYDVNQEVLGAEDDKGDVLIIKSGTDFRDLSEFTLDLEDTAQGSVRTKLIKGIRGACMRKAILRFSTDGGCQVFITRPSRALAQIRRYRSY